MSLNNIILEDVRIAFRNFAGKEGKYNAKGRRNFVVFLDPDLAEKLYDDGWNIKTLKPRDEEEEPQAYMQVAVNYEHIPPRIVLISNGQQTILDEESIDILDWAEIDTIDLIIRPYEWDVNGKTGVKAYVKTMYVTLEDDPLSAKYWQPDREEDDNE